MLESELKKGQMYIDNYGYKLTYLYTDIQINNCWNHYAKICIFYDHRSGNNIQRLFWDDEKADYENKDITKATN